jgi:hypothetical protein
VIIVHNYVFYERATREELNDSKHKKMISIYGCGSVVECLVRPWVQSLERQKDEKEREGERKEEEEGGGGGGGRWRKGRGGEEEEEEEMLRKGKYSYSDLMHSSCPVHICSNILLYFTNMYSYYMLITKINFKIHRI